MNQERQRCQSPLLHSFHNLGLLVVLRVNWVLSDICIKYWVFTVCYNRSGSARVVWCSSIKQSKADIDGVCVCVCFSACLLRCVCVYMTHVCLNVYACVCVCTRLCVPVWRIAHSCRSNICHGISWCVSQFTCSLTTLPLTSDSHFCRWPCFQHASRRMEWPGFMKKWWTLPGRSCRAWVCQPGKHPSSSFLPIVSTFNIINTLTFLVHAWLFWCVYDLFACVDMEGEGGGTLVYHLIWRTFVVNAEFDSGDISEIL